MDNWREVFERHENDPFAHPRERDRRRTDLATWQHANDERLTDVERFQQRIMGALIVLATIVGSGVVAVGIELARGK